MSEKNKELEITTQMQETLESAKEYIIKLIDGIEKCSKNFQGGQDLEAVKMMPIIADGLDWIIQAIELTSSVQKEKIDVLEMNEFFKEAIEGLENEDYILCGDLLEYEIAPILNSWKEKLYA